MISSSILFNAFDQALDNGFSKASLYGWLLEGYIGIGTWLLDFQSAVNGDMAEAFQ